MNQHISHLYHAYTPLDSRKFRNPDLTARGEVRARVALEQLDSLWINTGSLCNITCTNCYIESSPGNDRLAYFRLADALALYDEIGALGLATSEIGFTGGEPFMNPHLLAMTGAALERGFHVLILTNAMQPLQRPTMKKGLRELQAQFAGRLTLRVSLDHYTCQRHEAERTPGSWKLALAGLDWLSAEGISIAIAGRTCWGEDEASARAGYARLIAAHGWDVDAADPSRLVLFPEMDARVDVPEITTLCWSLLGKRPADVMCASSRMAVLRRGEEKPVILPCTLLPYDPAFEMGTSLAEMHGADGGNFDKGSVKLNHPHCAKFCVLGGGSCSAG